MAITQLNTYAHADNSKIQSLFENGIYKGYDNTYVVYSTGNYIVKSGSYIEANGNLYFVNADYSITASDGNLIFNSSTLAFSISATAPVYDVTKSGDYISSNERVCRWSMSNNVVFQRYNSIYMTNRTYGEIKGVVLYNSSGQYEQLKNQIVDGNKKCNGSQYYYVSRSGEEAYIYPTYISKDSNGYGLMNGLAYRRFLGESFTWQTYENKWALISGGFGTAYFTIGVQT